MEPYKALNKQFINGKWLDGSESAVIDNLNPFTEKIIHSMNSAGLPDVDAAFEAAKNSFASWAATDPLYRRELLLKAASLLKARRDEFISWLTQEVGSTYLHCLTEVQQAHDSIMEAAAFPMQMDGLTVYAVTEGTETYLYRKPLGIIALISPSNFPLYLSMRTIAPALATGNTMVVKPASQSLVTGATIIGKLLEEAGLPAGVLNVVVGSTDIIGDYFTGHPYSRMIAFTGSTPIGRRIGRIAGETLKKTALELGGNSAYIILDDADVAKAVEVGICGRFLNQGQVSTFVNRILVHEKIYKAFKNAFVTRAAQLPFGDPADKRTVIGPVIDRKTLERIRNLVNESIGMGAVLETGNIVRGNVMEPTVLSNVRPDMPICQQEILGPAVGIMPFSSDEDAIRFANSTAYGLSGVLYTNDIYRAMVIARKVETGMIHINDQSANEAMHTPFGKEKASMDALTTIQWVSVTKEI